VDDLRMPRSARVLQTARWIQSPYALMDACRAELGEMFAIDVLGWGRLVLIGDPALVREVFMEDGVHWSAGEANTLMRPLLGDRSVFLADGDVHRRLRSLLVRNFSRAAAERAAADVQQAARSVLRELPAGIRFEALSVAQRISLRVICRMVLGRADEALLRELAAPLRFLLGRASALVAFVQPLQRSWGPASVGFWFQRAKGRLDQQIRRAILERRARAAEPPECVLDGLIADGGLDDEAIRDQLVSLIVAGNDTVATAVAWALFWIHREPKALEGIRDELANAPAADPAAAARCPRLDAACRESLRISPTVEVVQRVGREAVVLGGTRIPAGALISPSAYLVQRDPGLYPDPERFDPERFLTRRYAPWEFFPFGGGLRRCIGANLGLVTLPVVVAEFLRRGPLELLDPRFRPARRNVTVAPAHGVPMRFGRVEPQWT
jgi:cytochrome P450 family 110